MLEELRITSLGVIEESVLELGPGFTAITGETGAGKTMVVTALGLLLGGRADSGAVRTGARAARVEGLVAIDADDSDLIEHVGAAIDAVGGDLEDGRLVLARQVSAEGRSRAFAGGVSLPVAALSSLADPLVAVHGQSDQHRLLRPAAQRDALDGFAGPSALALRARFETGHALLLDTERELAEVVSNARERAREADLLRFGLDEVAAVDPQPDEQDGLAAEETRLGFADTLRAAAEQARENLSAEEGPDALGAVSAARATPRRCARSRRRGGRARRPVGGDQLPALGRGGRRGVVRLSGGDRPGTSCGGLGAALGPGRADPQVRRHRRGGARVGARPRLRDCWSSTARTSGSTSCRSAAPSCARSWLGSPQRCRPSARTPPNGSAEW